MGVRCGNDEYNKEEINLILIFRQKEQAIKDSVLPHNTKQKQLDKLVRENTNLLISCPDLLKLKINELKDLLAQANAQNQSAPGNQVTLSKMDNAQTVAVNLVDENQASIMSKPSFNSIIDRYNQSHKVALGSGYKSGYAEPKIKNDGVHLQFPTAKESLAFMQALAQENKRFFVLDTNNHVKAYSTGDGMLYKADGTVYEKGARIESSNLTQADVAKNLLETVPASSPPTL